MHCVCAMLGLDVSVLEGQYNFFSNLNRDRFFQGKEVILILDDIDVIEKLDPVQRQSLLSQLSSIKRARVEGTTCVLSALALTNAEGDYLLDTLGHPPFNPLHNVIAPFFTEQEHNELFAQYEKEYGFVVDNAIKRDIFEQTQGAPGLEQLFGSHYHQMRKNRGRDLSRGEWMAVVVSRQFLRDIGSHPNYQHITLYLSGQDHNIQGKRLAPSFCLTTLVPILSSFHCV